MNLSKKRCPNSSTKLLPDRNDSLTAPRNRWNRSAICRFLMGSARTCGAHYCNPCAVFRLTTDRLRLYRSPVSVALEPRHPYHADTLHQVANPCPRRRTANRLRKPKSSRPSKAKMPWTCPYQHRRVLGQDTDRAHEIRTGITVLPCPSSSNSPPSYPSTHSQHRQSRFFAPKHPSHAIMISGHPAGFQPYIPAEPFHPR